MLSLLNNTNFFSQYGLLIVLVVALVVLMFISFNRRKKEDAYRNELMQKVVPGAMVKTYYGLYGKVLKVTETTDGKILLIESGEDKKVSYQNIHINAVYGIDEKQVVTLDENGNEYEFLNDYFENIHEAYSYVFLKGYQWPFSYGKINGSSRIDLAVHGEMLKGRKVYLDYRKNPDGFCYEKLSDEAKKYINSTNYH